MLGFNTGYVEELYRQYLDDPKSVSESWQEFFADYTPTESFAAAEEARKQIIPPAQPPTKSEVAVETIAQEEVRGGDGAVTEPVLPDPEAADTVALRGPAGKIAENMETSLQVPTATSVRSFPVKLMAENRKLINDFQRNIGGDKVSYTHLIGWAVIRGIQAVPNMNTYFRRSGDSLEHVQPHAINMGIAIDVERRGKRSLLVPNIKDCGNMTFPQFVGVYNDLVKRAREGKLELLDFQGTTVSLTNPGMIGTSLSVPRLMKGQGLIVGVGSIGYPPEYHAFPPDVVSKTGLSQVMTLTSTYDHRVIQGAQSGAFLAHVTQLLLGQQEFYDTVFTELGIPHQPYRLALDNTPAIGVSDVTAEQEMIRKQARVLQLIRAYRVRGHLQADVNPLDHAWEYHPELDPATYGLTIWDLDREFDTGGLGGMDGLLPLRDILEVIRDTYTRKIGVEYMHISSPEEKKWLQERIEPVRSSEELSADEKRRILSKMNAAEAFERFLHTKYIGHKRFSLEGAETVIALLDTILSSAADGNVQEVVIGMAHRGRLNVLANILEKPYEVIFSEFEGSLDPDTTQGSGDVKYHLGFEGTHASADNNEVAITLASNPSHLEAVNPVVEGMVRAKQTRRMDHPTEDHENDCWDAVMPLLIHGDAAFAGQGVVAETLNLSQLPGYHTGGTVHVVINNQIGFTTTPDEARSSTYATDVARMIQAPIFHVNGDDPEACVRVARMAFEYRQEFNKDVVIDMLCYRVHGHNEGDEPTYTQPLLYEKIQAKRSVRKLYTEALLARGEMNLEEAEKMLDDYQARLQDAFAETKEIAEKDAAREITLPDPSKEVESFGDVDTGVDRQGLDKVLNAIVSWPDDFGIHKKLVRQFDRRRKMYEEDGKVDWGLAEALAYGSILVEGQNVRLAGQDSQRGTFSHRHGVLVDQTNGDDYIPLNNIQEDQGQLLIFDSFLSEYAACGFEYGYSVADSDTLVLWEAQFGDFANGAQIVFDQFMSAAEEKWGQSSGLVLLLPHGYEGQGPEHSSARLERFLQLCAQGNMAVCNFTSPANLFHALRRQTKHEKKKPLVVMSPKSLLRHPMAVSSVDDLLEGSVRKLIPSNADPESVRKLVFCSGKVYFDIAAELEKDSEKADEIAVARLEQFYPFPAEEVGNEIRRYKQVTDVAWLQEEPENMGGWTFVRPRIEELLAEIRGEPCSRVTYIGRAASASPSTGSAKVHQLEQQSIVRDALS